MNTVQISQLRYQVPVCTNIPTPRLRCWSIAAALLLAACGPASQDPARVAVVAPATPARVDAARLLAADGEPGQWLSYGRTYSEQRWSPLDRIDVDTVAQLGLAWYADYDTNQPQESTPLFIDGVLYVTTAWSKVYAFDARTGRTLWQYDPKVPGEVNVHVCCGMDNRGAAAWNGRIIFGTLDGRLIALDAKTGRVDWVVQATPPGKTYSITGAPRIAKGMVFIGAAGGEYAVRGYLDAYDAETGRRLWRFWTVPGDPALGFENEAMRKAAATWSGQWWQVGGGGPVWDGILYDSVTDLVYFGTGNGTPWRAMDRDPNGGDNLFLASIVALDPDDGSYVWHYQENPWETWDYDATQPLMVADLVIDGAQRHVIMHAPKNGFFYVLDAATGELFSAQAFARMNWATGVDLATGRPIEVPAARYDVTGQSWNMLPGGAGAHSWHPMAYSPQTGLVYIPVQDMYFPFVTDPDYVPNPAGENLGIDFGAPATYYQAHPDEPQGFTGYLLAWDPVHQRQVWRSAIRPGATGGALATGGGLVFQGVGTSQQLLAYRADNGEEVWSAGIRTGVSAAPISYELDGEQYLAISVGGAQPGGYYAPNYSRLLVYKLGGTVQLPEATPYVPPPIDPPAQTASAEAIDRGRALFGARCAICHGPEGAARSSFPDLRRSAALHEQAMFDSIVLGGALSARGMASFSTLLDPPDAAALRAYIVALAHIALQQGPGTPFGEPPVP